MLRESNDDLKDQLHRERTEERRKLTAAKSKEDEPSQGGHSDRYGNPLKSSSEVTYSFLKNSAEVF